MLNFIISSSRSAISFRVPCQQFPSKWRPSSQLHAHDHLALLRATIVNNLSKQSRRAFHVRSTSKNLSPLLLDIPTSRISCRNNTILLGSQVRLFSPKKQTTYSFKSIREMSDKVRAEHANLQDELNTLAKRYPAKNRFFKTSFGQIGALEWGNPEAPFKILCVHGWLDNAGSFEPLAPYLLDEGDNSDKYHIISMDHPGCGLSSHKPTGSDYTTFSTIIEMRRITQELGWDKVILIAHSLGAHYSYLYSCIYPKQVIGYVAVDLPHPLAQSSNMWNLAIANAIENHFKYEFTHDEDPTTNIKVPVYSETDVLKRLMEAHSSSLTRRSAVIMLKRGAKKQRWGYTFTRDLRLRHMFLEMKLDDEFMFKKMELAFESNILIIRGNRSPYTRSESWRSKYNEMFARKCKIFRDVLLEGTHHLHMNSPEIVAPEISRFLSQVSKLEQQGGELPKGSKL